MALEGEADMYKETEIRVRLMEKETSGETNEKGRELVGAKTMPFHVLKKDMLSHAPTVISATLEGTRLTDRLNPAIVLWSVGMLGERE